MKDESKIVVAGRHPENYEGAVNPPVYHASTIVSKTMAEWEDSRRRREAGERGVYYGRVGTPTSFALEDFVTELEGGDHARVFPSGIAAIGTALTAYLNAGNHILVADNVYGPCRRLCERFLARFGVEHASSTRSTPNSVEGLFRPNTKVLYLEAPGSLTFEMLDIPRLAALGKAKGATVMMDNTWASPLFLQALRPWRRRFDPCRDEISGGPLRRHARRRQLHRRGLGRRLPNASLISAVRRAGRRLPRPARRPHAGHPPGTPSRTALALTDFFWSRPEVECVMYPGHPRDPGTRSGSATSPAPAASRHHPEAPARGRAPAPSSTGCSSSISARRGAAMKA